LESFFRLIPRLMPKVWSIFLLVPTGRAQQSEMLSGEQTEALFEELVGFSKQSGIRVKTTEGPHFRRVMLSRAATGDRRTPWQMAPTNDGRGFVFISHIGEIQPSGFLPIACGNVKCSNLLDTYRNAPVFRNLRNPEMLKGKCHECEYRGICGGSRARAYAVTGDYLAPEPTCIYQPSGSRIPKESSQLTALAS
jgi:radical SAM protein with 4Fe4S-binding SPASM domain